MFVSVLCFCSRICSSVCEWFSDFPRVMRAVREWSNARQWPHDWGQRQMGIVNCSTPKFAFFVFWKWRTETSIQCETNHTTIVYPIWLIIDLTLAWLIHICWQSMEIWTKNWSRSKQKLDVIGRYGKCVNWKAWENKI